MTSSFRSQLAEKLAEAKLTFDDFKGCTERDITEVMAAQNINYLPPSYIEFLKVMGHGSTTRNFMWGSSWTYAELRFMKQDFERETQKYDNMKLLLDHIFVFHDVEQYAFWFFRTEPQLPEPDVLLYKDGTVTIMNKSLTGFLLEMLEPYL